VIKGYDQASLQAPREKRRSLSSQRTPSTLCRPARVLKVRKREHVTHAETLSLNLSCC
jgi:hypothetical protein